MTVWPLYGLACGAAIGIAALSNKRERHDRKIAALAFFCGWMASVILDKRSLPIGNALIDLFVCYVLFMMWIDRPADWKRHIYLVALVMLACHVVHQLALSQGVQIGYYYRLTLNILFVCQLCIVTGDGAKNGLDRINRMLVPSGRGILRLYGLARGKANP